MKMEAQIMADLLHFGVQFLSPIPDKKETELVRRLARDAHNLFTKVMWEDRDLHGLLGQWFKRGREYERTAPGLDPVPEDANLALDDLTAFEIEGFFTLLGRDLDALCRLLWLWFQRGRSYERGNAA